jgi:hypothetical protein
MLLIWESNIIKVLSFVNTFIFVELILFSSAMSSIEGSLSIVDVYICSTDD